MNHTKQIENIVESACISDDTQEIILGYEKSKNRMIVKEIFGLKHNAKILQILIHNSSRTANPDTRKGTDTRTLKAEVLMDCGNIKHTTIHFQVCLKHNIIFTNFFLFLFQFVCFLPVALLSVNESWIGDEIITLRVDHRIICN